MVRLSVFSGPRKHSAWDKINNTEISSNLALKLNRDCFYFNWILLMIRRYTLQWTRPSSNYPHAKLISNPWINLFTQAQWSHSVSHQQWIFQTCGSIATFSLLLLSHSIKLRCIPLAAVTVLLHQWCRRQGCRGCKRTPKCLDMLKIRSKSLKIPGKICVNLGKIYENLCKIPENLGKNCTQWGLIWKKWRPTFAESHEDHCLCEYFLMKTVFGKKKSFHVNMHTLGPIFWKPKHIGRHFCLYFQGVCPDFHRFCPDFVAFCRYSGTLPGFSPHQNFWGCACTPASYTTVYRQANCHCKK